MQSPSNIPVHETGKTPILKIGTRGSPLALIQAHDVQRRLMAAHGLSQSDIVVEVISTAGDRSQPSNQPLRDIGGKGLFSKEIEDRLLDGSIDIAVHSSKDMATSLPEGLEMPIFLPREDVRDAFISKKVNAFADLPQGAIIGTSSIRRRAQMLRQRPDLKMVEFRGNVGTRLQKLADGVADATLLAAAGLLRSNQAENITEYLDPDIFPPAPAQGAIGIELRVGDDKTRNLVQPLNDADTAAKIIAERAFLAELDGSCRTPIGALTRQAGHNISVFGQILSLDGQQVFEAEMSGSASSGADIGRQLGQKLRELAGPDFFQALKEDA